MDYSYARPTMQSIVAYGAIGAMRYLGNDSRCIFAAERDDLLAHGLGIGLIWETSANRVLSGAPGGRQDAELANSYANTLGAPGSTPIYYATDYHALEPDISGAICDYYRAASDYGGREVRSYGGAPVLDHLANHLGLRGGWQPAAASWSDYRMSPNAVMHQQVAYVLNNSSDTNFVLCGDDEIDWLWGYEGGIPVNEDELRRIVNQECTNAINAAMGAMYTGPRALNIPDDPAVYELTWQDGQRVRRHITTPAEVSLLQYVDAVSGKPGDHPRTIKDPGQIEAFKCYPVISDDAGTQAEEPAGHAGGPLYREEDIEPVHYDD